MYDGQRFVKGGFRMHELFFHDGTCPSDAILQAFLAIAEAEPGRAGALISCQKRAKFACMTNAYQRAHRCLPC